MMNDDLSKKDNNKNVNTDNENKHDSSEKENNTNILNESQENQRIIGEATNEVLNKVINELSSLILEVKNTYQLNDTSAQNQASDDPAATSSISDRLIQVSNTLVAINTIKTQICQLPLDFCEREYIDIRVTPLLSTMELLSRTGYHLSNSASVLTTSPIVPRKKSKLKDTIDFVYDLNEETEDIYEVLKYRLKCIKHGIKSC